MPFKDRTKQLEYMRKYQQNLRTLSVTDKGLMEISLSLIDPSPVPVRDIEGEAIVNLRESIKTLGVLEPILVRPKSNGRYEIVFGNHRFYAAKGAGLTVIPAQIREMSDNDALFMAVVENVQRLEMNPVKEGEAYHNLFDRGYSVYMLSEKLGKSEGYIKGRINIYENLCPNLKEKLGKELTIATATAIAKLPAKQQEIVFKKVTEKKDGILYFYTKNNYPTQCGSANYTGGIPPKYCTCERCGAKHWRGIDADQERNTETTP